MSPPTDSLPIDLDLLSNAELKRLVVKQWEDLAELHRVVAALRDAIARLKGGPPRPDIEASVKPATPPPGARFKGTTSFVVQDLVIRRHVVDFRRERWLAADGRMLTAPLPAGIHGHFGPPLRRLVLAPYYQGQTTAPRLVTLLRTLGILISKREVVRLLNTGHDGFHAEARDVLRAGLTNAAWITVDDTGARHQAKNGFCTQVGNDHFRWF